MIPASVTLSTNASASSAGLLFPLVEPHSAELAEFGQLLGDASQSLTMTALSAPALTLSTSRRVTDLTNSSSIEPPLTPEGLLFTLTQGAALALQVPTQSLQPPTQSMSHLLIDPVVASQGELMHDRLETMASSVDLTQTDNSRLVIPAVQPVLTNGVFDNNTPKMLQSNQLTPAALNSMEATQPISQQASAPVMPKVLEPSALPISTPMPVATQPVPESLQATLATNASGLSVVAGEVSSRPLVLPNASSNNLLTDEEISSSILLRPLATPSMAQPVAPTMTSSVVQTMQSKPVSMTHHMNLTATPNVEGVTDEVFVDPLPLLGDTKAIMFAAIPVISSSSASLMQAASTSVDLVPSPLTHANSLVSMATTLATTADGSSSREQAKEGANEDHWMQVLSDAQAVNDSDAATADEFSLLFTSPLSSSPTSTSLLAAPLNLRQPQWTQEVAQRMQVMVNQSMNELEVRLDPLDLGPMKIKLTLDEQQKAHVTLSAQHGLTRDMLENALPRLKELLAQEGIELASASVDSGQQSSGQGQDNTRSGYNAASELSDEAANTQVGMTVVRSTENLVDQYA